MKVGTKRKAPVKAGRGGRKVKVLDTEEVSDAAGEEVNDQVSLSGIVTGAHLVVCGIGHF